MDAEVDLAQRGDTGADPGTTVRMFYALVPDAGVRLAFDELARTVAGRVRGRAVSAEHLHLTMAFLGEVSAASVHVLHTIGAGLPPAGAVLNFDTLGAWRASGVAWAAPSVVPTPIVALHAALATALTDAGFVLEARAFRAHVTLARRCIQPQPRTRCEPLRWRVDRWCFVSSELRPEGPLYREVATWPLAIATPTK